MTREETKERDEDEDEDDGDDHIAADYNNSRRHSCAEVLNHSITIYIGHKPKSLGERKTNAC